MLDVPIATTSLTTKLQVKVLSTRTGLDTSLQTIADYFSTHLHTVVGDPSLQEAALTITIGTLGIPRQTAQLPTQHGQEICLPMHLYRSLILLGPFYTLPLAQGPCAHCLDLRWQSIRPLTELKAFEKTLNTQAYGVHPKLTPFALESLWQFFLMLWQERQSAAPLPQPGEDSSSMVYAFTLDTLDTHQYQLLADPLCSWCAEQQEDDAEQAVVQLVSRHKPDLDSYRMQKADQYHLPLQAYINPVCGLLAAASHGDYSDTVTAPVTGVFKVRSRFDVHDAWWSGHGNSYYQSLYFGVLEGLERYAGHLARKKKTSVYDTYQHLAERALDPRACGLYTDRFYEHATHHYEAFTEDKPYHWVWGYSFQQQRPILVPEQLVYYLDWRKDCIPFIQECSNGCATGGTLEEALLHGLFELIERDAFLIAWYARLPLPRIDVSDCTDTATLFAIEMIDRLGYDLHLFDMRLDIKLPSVMCVAVRRDGGLGTHVYAAGTSMNPEDAIRAALCEVASYIPNFDNRVANNLNELKPMLTDFSHVRELSHHALLHGMPEMAHYSAWLLEERPTQGLKPLYQTWRQERPQSLDLLDDLTYCMEQIQQLGLDIIVVDQTTPEQEHVGLKTVSVIVPGLIPVDFGWHRQRALYMSRLRSVPRTAGYMQEDFDPTETQPIPHPFP